MSHVLNNIKKVSSLALLFISLYPILFIQKLIASEPLGVAKDYGIDLQSPVTEVAQDVYSMLYLNLI